MQYIGTHLLKKYKITNKNKNIMDKILIYLKVFLSIIVGIFLCDIDWSPLTLNQDT